MTKYTLANVETRNRENPKTFRIAPREAREKVGIGDLVQLIFEFDLKAGGRATERMWVEVTRRMVSGYEGALRNEPVHSEHGLSFDDAVQFGPEHIAQAECPHTHPEKEHAKRMAEERELQPEILLWACLEGEKDNLHAFAMAHVQSDPGGANLLAYETLCGANGKITAMAFGGETKCEACERKRAKLNIEPPARER